MAVVRVYVPDIASRHEPISLPRDEAHHVTQVLRLGRGAEVTVFDGTGREWHAQVTEARRHTVMVSLGEETVPAAEPPVRLTLAMAVVKGDTMDGVIRDATALGVSAIAPFRSAHVTVPVRARSSEATLDRWRRVAVAAAKQCERAVVPKIAAVASFEQTITSAADARIVMCVEPARGTAEGAIGARPHSAVLLVGPEGGWADAEIAYARIRGATLLTLGPRRLSAALAPVAAISVLWTRWGW